MNVTEIKRIALIDTEIDAKISSVTADNIEDYDDKAIMELLTEKNELEHRLQKGNRGKRSKRGSRRKSAGSPADCRHAEKSPDEIRR